MGCAFLPSADQMEGNLYTGPKFEHSIHGHYWTSTSVENGLNIYIPKSLYINHDGYIPTIENDKKDILRVYVFSILVILS